VATQPTADIPFQRAFHFAVFDVLCSTLQAKNAETAQPVNAPSITPYHHPAVVESVTSVHIAQNELVGCNAAITPAGTAAPSAQNTHHLAVEEEISSCSFVRSSLFLFIYLIKIL